MNAVITFRTTPDQREHLKTQAKVQEVTMSQILRAAVQRDLDAPTRGEISPAPQETGH